MKKFLIIFYVVLAQVCAGQPSITWQRYYNGPNMNDDFGFDICRGDGDNYYIVGNTWVPVDDAAIYVMKINLLGQPIWTKIITGDPPGIGATTVVPTDDGGCVVSGFRDTAFTIRLNPSGEIIWDKTYYDSNYYLAETFDLINIQDKGYIGCGRMYYDYGYIFKTDSIGNLEWKKVYSANFKKWFKSIIEIDNGFLITGHTRDQVSDAGKGTLTRIDNLGNIIWEKKYVVSGISVFLTKTFKIGNQFKLFGIGYNIKKQFSGIIILNTDATGEIIDTSFIAPPSERYFDLLDVYMLNPNKFILSSLVFKPTFPDTSYVDLRIIDSSSNTLYQSQFRNADYSYIESIVPAENGDLLFAGFLGRFESNYADIYAIRTDSMLSAPTINIVSNNLAVPDNFKLFQNYPNPFNPTTRIKFSVLRKSKINLTIYDVTGKQISTLLSEKNYDNGFYEINWNGIDFPSGIYFCVMKAGSYQQSKKLVLIK